MARYDPARQFDSFRDDSGWVGAAADDDLDQRLAAEDEPFDERQPHVMTALGAISPDALGVTLFGAWGRPLLAPGWEPGAVVIELEQLYATGVRSVVDLASAASAQERADLAWISARAPVHIVVGAGSTMAMATPTRDEQLRMGISLVEALPAPGRAAARLELPPFVRANTLSAITQPAAPTGKDDLQWTGWTIVAEPDEATSSLIQAALRAGARLVVIVSGRDAGVMAGAAALIRDLIGVGFGDRLALGYNADPMRVMERFPLLLMDAGLSAIAVRRILVDNPAKALTTQLG